MSRFIFGDDLGSIKVLRHRAASTIPEEEVKITTIRSETGEKRAGVQRLVACAGVNKTIEVKLATGLSNGSLAVHELSESDELDTVCKWTENRLKNNQFVGLSATASSVFSCTSNGALRRVSFSAGSTFPIQEDKGSLPTRLCDWKLSSDIQTFAYGGEEVELSVWNAEQAFQVTQADAAAPSGKKRRRAEVLFPGEIWRAKNVTNDSLNLRQPVRITSLSFLPCSGSNNHIVAGTLGNDVRRYDIRSARRPVAEWNGIGKVGGIKTLQPGFNEHELFVNDHGTNLFSIDLRNGQILFGYQGLSGAVTSIAPSPTEMASTSLDRFVRTHDTIAPAPAAGARLDKKGNVTSKTYVNCIPTCIVWDGNSNVSHAVETEMPEQDVWDALEEVSDAESDEPIIKRRNVKS